MRSHQRRSGWRCVTLLGGLMGLPVGAAPEALPPLPSTVPSAPGAGVVVPATPNPMTLSTDPPPFPEADPPAAWPPIPRSAAELPLQAGDAPGARAERERQRAQAHERVLDLLMPMNPEQIKTVIQSLETQERLASEPARPLPEAVMEAEPLDLTARTPPVIRATPGYGASVVFTDRTGRAWPMTAYQGFNANLFVVAAHAVSGDPEDLPTVLVIQPTARYGAGNVLVALQGLETPIVLTVVLGQTQADVRKEFKLRLAGPRAAPEYAPPAPAPVDRALIDVLNGLPPQSDAQPVNLAGAEPDARAWQVGDYTYLRTLAEIYSPAYEDRASSPSGLHAYKLRTVPVLLASHRGQMVEIRVHP